MRFPLFFGLIATLFFWQVALSQKFIFELEPGLKLGGLSFQKNNCAINSAGSTIYNFYEQNNVPAYQRGLNTNQFGIEPYLNATLFQIGNKWKFGLGLSTYISKSRLTISSKGNSYLTNADPKKVYTEYVSKKCMTQYQQFYVYATRCFPNFNQKVKYFSTSITFGIGINKPSMFNPQNQNEIFQSYLKNQLGYEMIITSEKNKFWGYHSPFLTLKYELTLFKKHPVQFFAMYVQGFSNNYSFQLSGQSIDGGSIVSKSINRGSGIRFGISKRLEFDKLNKTH